jgi:hypothetical protein
MDTFSHDLAFLSCMCRVNTKFFSTATETAMKTLLAGGVAGAVSRTVVAPFERLKIIFQVRRIAHDQAL